LIALRMHCWVSARAHQFVVGSGCLSRLHDIDMLCPRPSHFGLPIRTITDHG
jgi:hypothetical protein